MLSGPRRVRRAGLSLAEVVVVLAVLGIAAAAVGRLGLGQQAHYRDVATRTRMRDGLREGAAVLGAELRGIAPAAGDLYADEMRDASIAFRSTVGTWVLCGPLAPGARTLDVGDVMALDARPSPASASPATDAPSVGDSLWVYDSGADISGEDDQWRAALVSGVARLTGTCTGTPSAARDLFHLTLSSPVDARVEPHAPVRVFRRVRYALYQSSDGLWYLGFSDCRPIVRAPPCATLQPVSGPYEPSSVNPNRSGLVLRYLDDAGTPTADPASVARIDMILHARAGAATRLARDATERQSIALRNAAR